MKTLGILGGMGPLAGAYFYLRLTALTAASGDGEHLPVVLFGDPTVPDRTAHIAGIGESPVPALCRGVETLTRAGAQVIAMPCNTAHAYLREISAGTGAEFLDMPSLSVEYAASVGARSIGVLGTAGCYLAGVYQGACKRYGLGCILPEKDEIPCISELIYREKGGCHVFAEQYRPYAESLLSRGAETVILACTEISVAFSGTAHVHMIDALELLARCAVLTCGGVLKKEAAFDLQGTVSG